MTPEQQSVREFHQVFGATINEKPSVPSEQDQILRVDLITEERDELAEATYHYNPPNLVGVADALGDLLYVVYGAGVTYGIDLEPVFKEIHRSNMTKLWTEAEISSPAFHGNDYTCELVRAGVRCWLVKRADGKVIKSPSYSPADIAGVLKTQGL
jgi:predicted HAD superfamily Cof-like phosphohydrolase